MNIRSLSPSLRVLFQRKGEETQPVSPAYRHYGHRLAEVADYLGDHAATVWGG